MFSLKLYSKAFIYFFAFVSLCTPVCAQEQELNPVVVTDSFNELHLSDFLSSISVINRQQIEKSQSATLADLLLGEAGIEFGRNGGIGATSSFFLRGQDSKNVAVYIDGVRTPVDQIGSLQITDFPLAQIEKIEILRGNASALYGDSAIGGVINIFTRQGIGKPAPYGSVTSGGYGLIDVNTGYGGVVDDIKFNFQAGNLSSTGFSAMNTTQKKLANSDNDRYVSNYFSMHLEKTIATDTALGIRENHSYSDNSYDYATSFNHPLTTDTHNQTKTSKLFVLYLQTMVNPDWKSRVDVSSSKIEYEDFLNGSRNISYNGFGLNEGQQKSLRWFNTYAVNDKTVLNFGVYYSEDEQVFTGTNGDSYSTKRFSRGYFTGINRSMGNWSLQTNLRQDVMDIANTDASSVLTSIAPTSTSGLLGVGYAINPQWKLTTSISNGFSAPSAYDVSQNTKLSSEKFLSKEVSLNYLNGTQLFRTVVFEMTTQNSILYDDNGVASNTYSTENKGIETSAQTEWASYRVKASLVFQNPRSVTYDEALARRAKRYGSLDLSRAAGEYEFGTRVSAAGERKDSHFSDDMLSAYALLSLYASKKIDKDWTARLKIDNVFDKDYQLAYGYNTPGRTASAALVYQPK
ncbi:MAG: TonB-dependent receptor [Limnohabitans sp.]|nr:TonB-dependent receptor [Limnohabitans sp.]